MWDFSSRLRNDHQENRQKEEDSVSPKVDQDRARAWEVRLTDHGQEQYARKKYPQVGCPAVPAAG
jgi:hypothetical protein